MKTIMIDGISCQVGDGNDGEIIQRHIAKLTADNAKLSGDLTAAQTSHTTVIATKDGEIAKLTTDLSTASAKVTTLEAQVKDAEMTPAKLDKMVADRQVLVGKAKTMLGDKLVIDGKTDGEIRRQVVDAKLSDAAKGWSDDQVAISFATLSAGVKAGDATPVADYTGVNLSGHRPGGFQDLGRTIADGGGQGDQAKIEAIHADRSKRLSDAWKTPVAGAK